MKNGVCFTDRKAAGTQLAEAIRQTYGEFFNHGLIVATPRGGMVVASVVAKQLNLPLDLVAAGKIRAPLDPEVIIGAVAQDGSVVWNEKGLNALAIDNDYRVSAWERQYRDLKRRLEYLRQGKEPLDARGKDVILVDDGMATGYTMRATIAFLKGQQPSRIILAIPVAPQQLAEAFKEMVDGFICLTAPESFWSVGQFYADFGPVTDAEVISLLQNSCQI